MKKKKVLIIVMINVLLILSIVGISYALWTLNLTQTGENDIASTCFNISFTEKDNISLQKSYPLYDADGKKLTPYEFTITNNCDSYTSYAVNLEVLNTTTLTNNDAIKIMLSKAKNGAESELKLDLLSNYETVTKTLNNATTAFKLIEGYLEAKESRTYDLRVWLDENVTTETVNIQNTTFNSKVVVTANYVKEIPYATNVISELAKDADSSSTDVYTVPDKTSDSCTYTLAYDGTSDNNLRYVGANPCNYVTFNNEKAGWRIIGILKTIRNGQRIKLIRTNSIGKLPWDYTSGNSFSNNWETSSLQVLLNSGAYYNRTTGQSYNGSSTATALDFTSNGLTEEAKNQIDTVAWRLGSTDSYTNSSNGLASHWYDYERSVKVYGANHLEWYGKVGLMFISDYGYATSGGTNLNRASCLSKELYNWDGESDCNFNDWLYTGDYQRTLNINSARSWIVFDVSKTRAVTISNVTSAESVRPSVYLNLKNIIISGEGTPENPYELSL